MDLILSIWRLVQFRAGPDEVPVSLGFVVFLIALTLVVNIAQLTATLDVEHAAEQTGVILIVTLSFVYILLKFFGLAHRYIQTISSILGASLIINLILTPLVILAPYLFDQANSEAVRYTATFFYLICLFFMNLWMVLVMAFIFQRALGSSLFIGVVVTMGLFACNMLVLSQLFPL